MPAHPALFVSRKLYRQYGVFKTDYAIAGDFEFVARLFVDNLGRFLDGEPLKEIVNRAAGY